MSWDSRLLSSCARRLFSKAAVAVAGSSNGTGLEPSPGTSLSLSHSGDRDEYGSIVGS